LVIQVTHVDKMKAPRVIPETSIHGRCVLR